MPYLLLIVGILVGLYALYRFFLVADMHQIKALFLTGFLVIISLAIFILAITGRLPAAFAIIGAIAPIVWGMYARRNKTKAEDSNESKNSATLSLDEAYDILGLKPGASIDDIEKAYKKLMKKVHPDQEGSQWMATKLNAARDLLLPPKEENGD